MGGKHPHGRRIAVRIDRTEFGQQLHITHEGVRKSRYACPRKGKPAPMR
jgi:hypothetical protein